MTIHEAASRLNVRSLPLLRRWLADKERFPKSEHIIVNGHCHWNVHEDDVAGFVPRPAHRPKMGQSDK